MREKACQRHVRFNYRRLQHHEAEIFVYPDIHFYQSLHDRLVFGDSSGHELHEVVIAPRYQVALDNRIYLIHRAEESGEVNLAVILEGYFGENRQDLAELGNVDQRRIADNVALGLQFLDAHQAWAGRQTDKVSQFHIGDASILLQFRENLDVDPVELHSETI
jgi:hypothetical protein